MNNKKLFVGDYFVYPDRTKARKAEGGKRVIDGTKKKKHDVPLVSIITIVYNMADQLKETINSVVNQTYENIEYIIVDGGSTDDSLDVIKEHEAQIDYFVSEPDNGIYHAMNKGLSLAQGDYICLLNAGDFYLETFVEKSVKIARECDAEIVYSAVSWFGTDRYPIEINSGIYLHHLNINHMTFLVAKQTYNKIGFYNESFDLFSDDIWTRTAFLNGARFVYLPELLVIFSGGGLSGGDTKEKRKAIFDESIAILRQIFPFLTYSETEMLIESRFKINKIDQLIVIYDKYASQEPLFKESFSNYLKFMLENRENFIFNEIKTKQFLQKYIFLAEKLNIPYSSFRFSIPNVDVNEIYKNIEKIKQNINEKSKCLIHFASNFSSPSETFIYDLVLRLNEEPDIENVFLCDNRLLSHERPFTNCVHIDWDNLPKTICILVYKYLFKTINPNVLMAHFALNGWKINQRLSPIGIKIPTVLMTHGIDVFSIDTKPKYEDYILESSLDPSVHFTTVSKYLHEELVARGVPEDKISIIPNVVHDRFFKHRKITNYYDSSRNLEVLNVGRLLELKGHAELLEGIKYYIENHSKAIHLTIVYGRDESNKKNLTQRIDDLQLKSYVTLIDFVDFDKSPGFYSNFDVFVSSSKYSSGRIYRSETFGMSTLEAITAGLPVVVTDAGGSPEVVGGNTKFSKIVPHKNGMAIGIALVEFATEKVCFSDNIEYAEERLSLFNAKKQVNQIRTVLENTMKTKMKIAIFSSMLGGGAGKAAARVHKSLLINGVDSTCLTRDNQNAGLYSQYFHYISPEIGNEWDEIQSRSHFRRGFTMFSLNEPNLKRATLQALVSDMDVVNIHWIARFLTAEDIGYISNLEKPLVITVRDMNPLTGGCHFFHGCDRWKYDCYGCPQLVGDEGHFPKKVLALKKLYWNMKNITFVALSQHSVNIIKQSAIYDNNKIEVIANPIELDVFLPTQKEEARNYFNIKKKAPFIFYVPSYSSRVKGSYEFKEALYYIKDKYPEFQLTLIMAGSATALVNESEFFFPIVHLGSFTDNKLLAKAYSAANATVVPSLEETFSNTAAESISCGTPVVGFKTGAIPDIAGDGLRGESVPVGDVKALGEAIYRVLNRPDCTENCRSYAEENFSYREQGKKYTELFKKLKSSTKQKNHINPDDIPVIDASVAEDIYHWQSKTAQIKFKQASKKQQSKKSISLEKRSIMKLNKDFSDFCRISLLLNPKQKVKSYNVALNNWKGIKQAEDCQIWEQNDFFKAIDNLCSIDVNQEPIKKVGYYLKLLIVWNKQK